MIMTKQEARNLREKGRKAADSAFVLGMRLNGYAEIDRPRFENLAERGTAIAKLLDVLDDDIRAAIKQFDTTTQEEA